MVTSFKEVRDYPSHDLRQVQILAALQRVYVTRSVLRDSTNLGYEIGDICGCLRALQARDFRRSVRCETAVWHDVYEIRFMGPAQHVDDLYIKLSLGQDCVVVNLFSFHLTRTI